MAFPKLLGRVSAVGLQYVGVLCAILVVFGPSMSSVNASPYKLEFFKPCDPDGWNKNFHEGHTQEEAPSTPKPPMGVVTTTLPPTSTTPVTVATSPGSTLPPPITQGTDTPPTRPPGAHDHEEPATGVSDVASGLGAPPPELGKETTDVDSEQIGNYNISSINCKAKGANRKVAFFPGEHYVSNFHYVSPGLDDPTPKSNGFGVFAQGVPQIPPELLRETKFQSKLKGVLDSSGTAGKAGKGGKTTETTTRGKPSRSKRNHENGGKWDWTYLGPLAQFPITPLTVYQNQGAMYSQGASECDVKAEPKGGGGGETVYKIRILSGIAVDTTPPYGACTPKFGFIPIYNADSKSYSFDNAGGATEKDLVVTIPSGLVWEGSPKMWVAPALTGEKDVWYNDWHKELQLVVKRITDAWDATVKGVSLQLQPENNHWEPIKVPIPPGHSIRVYQSAAQCNTYGVLGISTGVRLFKGGACVPLPPQLLSLDTLRLGNCNDCKDLDSCKGPDECKGQCTGILQRFEPTFFLH